MTSEDRDQGFQVRIFFGRFISASLVAILLLSASCSRISDGVHIDAPQRIATTGVDLDLVRAIEETINLIEQTPHSAALRGRLAMMYEVNHFPAMALTMYEQAILLDPREFAWLYFAALIHKQQGDFDEAINKMDRAIEIDPDYVPVHLHRGTWLLEQNRLEESLKSFHAASRLGAGSPAAVGLAQVYLRQGNPEGVVDVLEGYSQTIPHPQIWRLLASAYSQLGQDREAEVARALGSEAMPLQWLDPIRQRPNRYVYGFGRRIVHAQSLLRSNRFEEALLELESLQKIDRNNEALLSNLAAAYEKTGNPEKAKEVLEYGIEQFPEQFRFFTHLGDLMYRAGHNEDALALLNKSIAMSERNPTAYERQGLVFMKLERFDEAIDAFESAVEYGHDKVAEIRRRVGTIHGMREQWTEAIDQFSQAVQLDPSNVDGHVFLAHAMIADGKFDKAEAAVLWAQRLGLGGAELESVERTLIQAQLSTDTSNP